MNIVDEITKKNIKKDVPEFRVGDTVKVGVYIKEGDKVRVQNYEGIVVSKTSGGVSERFTVRKNSSGVGVERVFPVNSPRIESITVVKRGKVRRAKLNFLKGRKKQYKIKERGQG